MIMEHDDVTSCFISAQELEIKHTIRVYTPIDAQFIVYLNTERCLIPDVVYCVC